MIYKVDSSYMLNKQLWVVSFCVVFQLWAYPGWADEEGNAPSKGALTPFEPFLVESHDERCEEMLTDTREKYLSGANFFRVYSSRKDEAAILDLTRLESGAETVTAYNKLYYLGIAAPQYCRGFCDTFHPIVSTTPLPRSPFSPEAIKLRETAPADTGSYLIAHKEPAPPYLFMPQGDDTKSLDGLKIYRLAEQGMWTLACNISTQPSYSSEEQLIVKTVRDSFRQLETAFINGIVRGSGGLYEANCRPRNSAGYAKKFAIILEGLLRRPSVNAQNHYTSGSVKKYRQYLPHLKMWSTQGVDEYDSFSEYSKYLDKSTYDLAMYYNVVFGLSEKDAELHAFDLLRAAVSTGMHSYPPPPLVSNKPVSNGESLQEKILRGAPFDEIQSTAPKRENVPIFDHISLSVSVRSPDVTAALLERGEDPNSTNGFGKTPLMYAAQYNQLETAKVLLAAGAFHSSATTKPVNECYYSISTLSMTPLHYAVRYGSFDMIKLLVDSGAATFISTNHIHGGGDPGLPLDWFYRYNSEGSRESNPNIFPSEHDSIIKMLSPPDEQKKIQLTKRYIRDAEKSYQNGAITRSYELLGLALLLEPKNERALGNMALVGTKAKRIDNAVLASHTLIENSERASTLASAWFNMGLACKAHYASQGKGSLEAGGKTFCKGDAIQPFLKSYVKKPSSGRENMLRKLLQEAPKTECGHFETEEVVHTFHVTKYENRMYILVPKVDGIDVSSLSWGRPSYSGVQTLESAGLVLDERHRLSHSAMEVLSFDVLSSGDLHVDGVKCVIP